jgi:hypothetical protein
MMLAKGARDHLDSDVRHHPTGSNRWRLAIFICGLPFISFDYAWA